MNGIVGIKPTVGLVNAAGIIPIAVSQDTAGPMTRTVADGRALLAGMLDTRNTSGQIMATELRSTRASGGGLTGARIGVARAYCGYHDELDEVFNSTLARLANAGATIVDPVDVAAAEEMRPHERLVMAYEFKAGLNAYFAGRPQNTPPQSLEDLIAFNALHAGKAMPYFKQELLEAAAACGSLSDPEYGAARQRCIELARGSIDTAHVEHNLDAIVAPTASPAWAIDWVCGDNRKGGASAPAAIAGYPHVTVPMGWVRHLPVGLSLFTTAMRDAELLVLAETFEGVRDA
jgi:Asp-tRNA(Asn)/Glu-tRNA(Gln) amidotransferase A subunit family amidase